MSRKSYAPAPWSMFVPFDGYVYRKLFERPTSRKISNHRAKHATYIHIECTQLELLQEPEPLAADLHRTRRPNQTGPAHTRTLVPLQHSSSALMLQSLTSAHRHPHNKSSTPPQQALASTSIALASRSRDSVLKNEYHGVQALVLHQLAHQDLLDKPPR